MTAQPESASVAGGDRAAEPTGAGAPLGPALSGKVAPEQPVRIFVKGLNWVGDAILSTPALTHLRRCFPKAHITLMVRPWVAAVHENSPDIDDLWVFDDGESWGSFYKATQMIRKGCFDIGIALPNSTRSAALLHLGGVRYRIGFNLGGRQFLLNRGLRRDPSLLEDHQIFYYLRIIEHLCGKAQGRQQLSLTPGELEVEEAGQVLAQRGLDRGRPLIGIAPGSINSTAKRWPAERFAELADQLKEKTEAEVLLLGSEKEKDVLDRVEASAQTVVHNLGGQLGLGQAIAMIARLNGLICNDSGAMHIAAALGIPTVAIFGPTEWQTTYPFSKSAVIVRKEGIDCAPCMRRDCPIDHRCMTRISVQEVFDRFKQTVRQARKDRPASNPS